MAGSGGTQYLVMILMEMSPLRLMHLNSWFSVEDAIMLIYRTFGNWSLAYLFR